MTTSTIHRSEPSPWERQFNAVIEGVTRSLTHLSNVFDRMRRHHREDHRESLKNFDELKAIIVKGHLDDQKRQTDIETTIQGVMHEVLRNRAVFICSDDQEKD